LGFDLLLDLKTLGNQFGVFSKLFLQDSNLDSKFRPHNPSLALSSFSLFPSLQTDQGDSPAGLF
jgi:hypothetical protein